MKTTLAILFLGFTSFIYSQNTLSGIISDTHKQPVAGADVYLPQVHKGTVSNDKGEYKLENIPNGKIDITIIFLGFETLNKTLEINADTIHDFVLQESVLEMDEVIISTPFNKLQSHNVMAVESKKISNSNPGAVNLTEKIANIPGVNSIATGNGIGKPVIRGLSGNRVLVYTQGIRYENQQFGEKHGLGIDDNGIENVEVIKGPASLLYGSDAMGGVIYLIPEKFRNKNGISGSLNSTYQTNT
ncbi:MAG: TonB-dependent receptor, partial [Flavobacteriaceae bacterium]|nr:TonB-dependent receptor [Flavobacteriaceae bacterium]